jgi:hypothetical protein
MTTTITSTVGPGKNYSTLSAWYSAVSGNLISLDQIQQAEVYAFADSASFTMTGSITDSNRYFRIFAFSGSEHNGNWNLNSYRLTATSSFAAVLTINDNFVYLEGIQLENLGTQANNSRVIEIGNLSSGSITSIDRCIIKGSGVTTTPTSASAGIRAIMASGSTLRIRNSLIYKNAIGIIDPIGTSGIFVISYNNSIVKNSLKGILFINSNHSYNFINNLISGSLTDWDLAGTGNNNYFTNISSDATSPNASLQNKNVIFVNESLDDYHLASNDVSATSAGTDLSADSTWSFSIDADKQSRTAPWSIGMDQLINNISSLVTPNIHGLIWPMRNRITLQMISGLIFPRPRITNR